MLTIFHVQNVLIILDWCLCHFLLLKHIDEVHALHVDLSFTYVDIFFCVENILEFQYCFWLFTDVDYFSCGKCCYHCQLMFMWFSVTEIYRWSGWTSIFICHLLMLTYFLCGNVLRFQYCFWLFTDVDYFSCGKCCYHSRLMFMSFCHWNIPMKWMDYHLHLSLTDVDIFFCVENILRFEYCFWLFTDVDYFSCGKCSYPFRLMFMWFSVTETYWCSACTSCWFVIYLCWHIFCVENILQFEYCFWLFTDVPKFL